MKIFLQNGLQEFIVEIPKSKFFKNATQQRSPHMVVGARLPGSKAEQEQHKHICQLRRYVILLASGSLQVQRVAPSRHQYAFHTVCVYKP